MDPAFYLMVGAVCGFGVLLLSLLLAIMLTERHAVEFGPLRTQYFPAPPLDKPVETLPPAPTAPTSAQRAEFRAQMAKRETRLRQLVHETQSPPAR